MTIEYIEKLNDGYIIFTKEILTRSQKDAVKDELKRISALPLGLLFFRTVQ